MELRETRRHDSKFDLFSLVHRPSQTNLTLQNIENPSNDGNAHVHTCQQNPHTTTAPTKS